MSRYARWVALVAIPLLLALAGCQKDEERDVRLTIQGDSSEKLASLKLRTNEIAMAPRAVAEVEIATGTGEYLVTSEDKGVATASIKDDKSAVVIRAEDLAAEMNTVITLEDQRSKQQAKIRVKVTTKGTIAPLEIRSLPEGKLSLRPGETSAVLQITGGTPLYSIKSNSEGKVATASLSTEGKLTITGLQEGQSVLVIADAAGRENVIEVRVKYVELELPGSLALELGESREVPIIKGNFGYKASSKSTGVVGVEVQDDAKLVLRGQAKGETDITVTDRSGKTATIKLRVVEKGKLVRLNGKAMLQLTHKLGEAVPTIRITGGDSDKYKAETGDAAIVEAKIVKGSDNTLELDLKGGVGTTRVSVSDGAETATLSLTVEENRPIELQQTDVTIDSEQVLSVGFSGGVPPYRVEVSDGDIVSALAKNDLLRITAKRNGSTTLTLSDKTGRNSATVKVTVRLPIIAMHDGKPLGPGDVIYLAQGDTDASVRLVGGAWPLTAVSSAGCRVGVENGALRIEGVTETAFPTITITDTEGREHSIRVYVCNAPKKGESKAFIVTREGYALPRGNPQEFAQYVKEEGGKIVMPKATKRIRAQRSQRYREGFEAIKELELREVQEMEYAEGKGGMVDFIKVERLKLHHPTKFGKQCFNTGNADKRCQLLHIELHRDMREEDIKKIEVAEDSFNYRGITVHHPEGTRQMARFVFQKAKFEWDFSISSYESLR